MGRAAFKILLKKPTQLDRALACFVHTWILKNLRELPQEIFEDRQVFSELQRRNGVDHQRLRRLCSDLDIDPYKERIVK